MAVFAIYIEKETEYFGERRKFGNIYHYRTAPGELFNDANVAQAVHDAEQNVLSPDADFVGWQSYGPTDGPVFDNVMREDGTFADSGNALAGASMYAEACLLCVWPLARSPVTNRKRWLRKFIRLGATAPVFTDAQLRGADALTSTQLAYILTNYIEPVTTVTGVVGSDHPLCTEDGDTPEKPGLCRPFLYTRQIGQ